MTIEGRGTWWSAERRARVRTVAWWLQQQLAGGPVRVNKLSRAAKKARISSEDLHSAKYLLGVRYAPRLATEPTAWMLPDFAPKAWLNGSQ